MYVRYLPELLLMIEEKDVVNKLVKTRRLIQEQDIETIPSKLPGKVLKLKIDEVRPYLDEDALAALISFELKNTYVGSMPFLYPYIYMWICVHISILNIKQNSIKLLLIFIV
jgi:hypothetical protein